MRKLSKKEMGERVTEFINSPEGKRKIKEAFERAEKASKVFAEACYIHPNDPRLLEPFTV